jgi:hypothetical protein
MGVDAAIFAKESKHYFYFDRQWNLLDFEALDGEGGEGDVIADICANLAGRSAGGLANYEVKAEEVLRLIAWKRAINDDNGWLAHIERFVKEHPNDTFFTRNDHERESMDDVIERDVYTEVRYE